MHIHIWTRDLTLMPSFGSFIMTRQDRRSRPSGETFRTICLPTLHFKENESGYILRKVDDIELNSSFFIKPITSSKSTSVRTPFLHSRHAVTEKGRETQKDKSETTFTLKKIRKDKNNTKQAKDHNDVIHCYTIDWVIIALTLCKVPFEGCSREPRKQEKTLRCF